VIVLLVVVQVDLLEGAAQVIDLYGILLIGGSQKRVLVVLSTYGLEDEHAVVGGYGPAALRDYGGAGYLLIIADLLDGVDHIIGILAQGVVGAGGRGGVGAVIVHRKAPPHI